MTDAIKRNSDGSIDTAHYVARAHRIRSEAAHRALGALAVPAPEAALRRLFARRAPRAGAAIPAE